MPRELSKCREWEKDRRERLKKGFASLSKVLPCYEPSINLSKIDILQKAEAYIDELQTQIKELLDKKSTKIECNTIKKLSDRVKKLAVRNEQLCNLLIEAGIKLPSECGNVKKFKGTKIWSNKISHDQAKKLLKKEKDNEQKKVKKKVQNKIRKTKKGGLQKKIRKKPDSNNKSVIITNQLQSTNFITLVTTQSCFIITNAPSKNVNQNLSKTTTVLTNSNLFSTPLVASTVKPPLVITKSSNGPLNTVTSGTLLVANGSLLPIIQQPTIIPSSTIINPTPIVVKSAVTNNPTTLLVVPKTDTKEISNNKSSISTLATNAKVIQNIKTANVTKQLAVLRPKINDVSYPNKVPIPPLTSKTNDYISHNTTSQSTKCIKSKSNKNAKKESSAKSTKEDTTQNEKVTETSTSEDKVIKPSPNNKKDTSEDAEPPPKKTKLNTDVTNGNNDDKRLPATSTYSIDSLCNDLGDIANTTTAVSVSNKVDNIKETEKEIVTNHETTLTEISTKDKQNEKCAIISQTELVISKASQENNNQTTINSVAVDDESKEKEVLDKNKEKAKEQKDAEINNTLMHSDLSNDIFASLTHVSTGGQNPESTSPTAAFLLAFPLVSSLNSLKVTEVIEDEANESQHGTPTLLQIGTMDTTKTTQSQSDTLTPNLLNLDNFSFFSREFYPPFEPIMASSVSSTITSSTISSSFVYPPIASSSAIYPSVTFSSVCSPVTSSPAVYHSVTSSAYPVVTSSSVKYPVVSATAAYTTTSHKHSTAISSSSALYSTEVSFTPSTVFTTSSSQASAKHPVMSSSTIYSPLQPSSVHAGITSSKVVTSSVHSTTTSTSSVQLATTSAASFYPATMSSSVVNSSVFLTTSSTIHPSVTSSVKLPISSSGSYSVGASSVYSSTTSASNQSICPTTSSFTIYPASSIYPSTRSSSVYPVITSSAYPTITAPSALNSSVYSTLSSSTIRPAITSSSSGTYPVVVSSVYPGITLSSNQSLYSPASSLSSIYPIVTSSAYSVATSSSSVYPATTTSYSSVASSIYPALTSSSTVYSVVSSSSAIHPIVVSSTYQPITSLTSAIYPIMTSSLSLAITSSVTTSAVYSCVTSSTYTTLASLSSSVSYPTVNSSVGYQAVTSSTYLTVTSSSVYPIVTSSIAFPMLTKSATYPIVPPPVCPAVTTTSTVSSTMPKVVDIKKEFVDFHTNGNSKKLLNSDVNPKDDMKFSLKSVSNKDSFLYLDDKTCVSQNSIPVSVPTTTTYMNRTDYNSYVHPFYTNAQTLTTSLSTTVTSTKHQPEKSKISDKKTCSYYPTTTSYSVPQYNTFNPFTDIPKTTTTYSITTKAYNDTLYTNNTTYSYNYHHDNFAAYPTTKSNLKADKLYYGLNYENYEYKNPEFQKYDSRNQQFGNYYMQNNIQNKEKSNEANKNSLVANSNINKVPVNWMTTPDIRQQPQNDFVVPSLGKDVDFTPNPIYSTSSFNASQATYFNANTNLYSTSDLHSNAPFPTIPPNSFQRNEVEENQFSWSPSKLPHLLDTSHNFVSSTLPTLVGDLALGNTQPFIDQKIEKKDFRSKENSRRSKSQTNYDNNQSNFLSVSQLVDHNKSDTVPDRVTNRRGSGNRSSKTSGGKSNKRVAKTEKEMHYNSNTGNTNNKAVEKQIKRNTNQEYQTQSSESNTNWVATNKNRNIKMPSSSYSAEALIGHQNQTDRIRNSQNYPVNKSLPVPFLPDNIIPYFPMDIPQENTLTQQNQNYQAAGAFGHNFATGIQGSVYSTNSFVPNAPPITTSYLPSTNFIPDIGCGAEYAPIMPDNTFSHIVNRPSDKFSKSKPLHNEKQNDKRNAMQTNNCPINPPNTGKKGKRKQNNEPNLSNFDFNFLSVPAAINSPILPDDFHTHSNFLPPPTPTQLYPCKNPLYGKQDLATNSLLPLHASTRSGIPHPEASPSLNNVGNTLTNFNLSTIFPEINKVSGAIADVYSNNGKTKEYNQRDFLGSTSQVPFKSNMSYINSPTSNNN